MSDRAFSRKRPRWLIWVPSLLAVALIAGAGILAGQVSSGSVGRDAPPEVAEAVTQDGYSRFSEDGITYITNSLQARVDLSEPEPDAADLGLPSDGETVVEANGFSVSVGLYVGDESIRIPTSSMTLTTADGRLVGLALVASSGGYQAQSAILESVAERFGLDLGTVDLDAEVAEDVRAGSAADYSFGPGTDFGRPTTATVAVASAGGSTLTIDVDFAS